MANLRFYSGEFNSNTLVVFHLAQNKLLTENAWFDLNTGMYVPGDSKLFSRLNYVLLYSPYGNPYNVKPIPLPSKKKKGTEFYLQYLSNLEAAEDCYIAFYRIDFYSKKTGFQREVQVYKINKKTNITELLNSYDPNRGGGFANYTLSKKGNSFLTPTNNVHTNYGKNLAMLETPPTNTAPILFSKGYDWFSDDGDTLYRLDTQLKLSVYNANTGKIERSQQFTNNHFSKKDSYIIAASEKAMKYVAITDDYLYNIDPVGNRSYNQSKAVLLDLNKPDYMLPLVNPNYNEETYIAITNKEKQGYAAYQAFREEERQRILKKYGLDKKENSIQSLMDEEDDTPSNKNIKRKSSSGACIWCGGSGKVTSKDVYNKGYNTTYTSTGSRKTQSTGNESYSTSVCGACMGRGH